MVEGKKGGAGVSGLEALNLSQEEAFLTDLLEAP